MGLQNRFDILFVKDVCPDYGGKRTPQVFWVSAEGLKSPEVEMEDREILTRIKTLNLEPMVFCLVEKDEGPKWTLKRARVAEKWYRRFLFLIAKYPSRVIVPTKEIDQIWHTHILDSEKYFEDCGVVFGGYLHHFPYLGVRGDEDKKNLEDAFYQTMALFEFHFNETPIGAEKDANASICGGGGHCSSGCSNKTPNVSIDLTTRPVVRAQICG